jgi:predicted ATPase
MRKRCVISGAPGSGKTTVVEALSAYPGAWTSKETAKELQTGTLGAEGKKLWENRISATDIRARKRARLKFEELVLDKDIEAFMKAPVKEKQCFFDCGIAEAYSYLKLEEVEVPKRFLSALRAYRYDYVFMMPIWTELFRLSDKPGAMAWAEKLSKIITDTYESLGYRIIYVPKGPVAERAKFIIEQLTK